MSLLFLSVKSITSSIGFLFMSSLQVFNSVVSSSYFYTTSSFISISVVRFLFNSISITSISSSGIVSAIISGSSLKISINSFSSVSYYSLSDSIYRVA